MAFASPASMSPMSPPLKPEQAARDEHLKREGERIMAAGLVRTTALPSLLDPTPASARAPVASPLISTARPPVASPPAYQAALQQQAMQLHLAKQRLHAEKVDFDKKRAEKLAGEEKERIAKDKINLQKDKDTEEALRRKSGIVGKEDERKGPLPTTMPPHAHRPAASMTLPPPPLPTAPPTSPQMPRPMNPMPPNYNGMMQGMGPYGGMNGGLMGMGGMGGMMGRMGMPGMMGAAAGMMQRPYYPPPTPYPPPPPPIVRPAPVQLPPPQQQQLNQQMMQQLATMQQQLVIAQAEKQKREAEDKRKAEEEKKRKAKAKRRSSDSEEESGSDEEARHQPRHASRRPSRPILRRRPSDLGEPEDATPQAEGDRTRSMAQDALRELNGLDPRSSPPPQPGTSVPSDTAARPAPTGRPRSLHEELAGPPPAERQSALGPDDERRRGAPPAPNSERRGSTSDNPNVRNFGGTRAMPMWAADDDAATQSFPPSPIRVGHVTMPERKMSKTPLAPSIFEQLQREEDKLASTQTRASSDFIKRSPSPDSCMRRSERDSAFASPSKPLQLETARSHFPRVEAGDDMDRLRAAASDQDDALDELVKDIMRHAESVPADRHSRSFRSMRSSSPYRIEPSYAEESTPPARQPIPQPRQRLNRSSSVSPYGLRHQLEYGMAQSAQHAAMLQHIALEDEGVRQQLEQLALLEANDRLAHHQYNQEVASQQQAAQDYAIQSAAAAQSYQRPQMQSYTMTEAASMPQQMLMPSHLEPSFLSFDRPPQDFPPLRSGDPLAFNLPPLLQLDDDVPRFSGDRTPPSLPRDPSFSLLEELEYGSYEGRQGCNGKLTRSGTVTPRMAFND